MYSYWSHEAPCSLLPNADNSPGHVMVIPLLTLAARLMASAQTQLTCFKPVLVQQLQKQPALLNKSHPLWVTSSVNQASEGLCLHRIHEASRTSQKCTAHYQNRRFSMRNWWQIQTGIKPMAQGIPPYLDAPNLRL